MPGFNLESARRISRVVRRVEAMHGGTGQRRGKFDGLAGGLFPVSLEQIGGADGSPTSAATWTYDIYPFAPDGPDEYSPEPYVEAVDIAASPHNWQRTDGVVMPATKGIAFGVPGPDLVLIWCDEVYGGEPCGETET